MAKSGINILADIPGSGPLLKKGDRVRVSYSIQLNHGDYLTEHTDAVFTIGDRNVIAGFRYGLEGMRVGGTRRFTGSPHLCYRDLELEQIPKNAVLVFDITNVELLR